MPYACRQSGPEASEKVSLSGSDGGLVMQRNMDICGVCACGIHWFLHKFNVDLVDIVQAFKAAARLMCPAAATAPDPLLNPTHASIHLPQFTAAGIPLS